MRFKLDPADGMLLVFTCIAAGQDIAGMPVQMMVDALAGFFREVCSTGSPQSAADQLYASVQCTLMALRKDDFLTIQREAPFNRRGKANFAAMIAAYNQTGEEGLRQKIIEIRSQPPENEASIEYTGAPGSSPKNAVRIHADESSLGVACEHWYLNYTYGRITKRAVRLETDAAGTPYDVFSFTDPSGESKTVYFNIAHFFTMRSS